MGGILASASEAAIRVAIQAHLPEDGGREGRREEIEQIYERKRRGPGGRGVACSQSVTEIERFRERGGDTEAERESTKQRDGGRALR